MSSLRKLLLLGAGVTLPFALTACGSGADRERSQPAEASYDGAERMSRPVFAGFAPSSDGAAGTPGLRRRDGGGQPFMVSPGSVEAPAPWSPQPSWATIDPPPLAEETWWPAPPQESTADYYSDPPAQSAPGASGGVILATLLETLVEAAPRPAPVASGRPRWHGREHGAGGYRDRRPPRAGGGRPGRPGPRPSAEPTHSLPRAIPLERVPAADLALADRRPQTVRPEADAGRGVDRDEIRARLDEARLLERERQAEAERMAAARRDAEERQARARQEESQRLAAEASRREADAAREAEKQRARAAEEQRLAAEARRAAAEQQARAAQEQAERAARMREEQRRAQALARAVAPSTPPPPAAQAAQPAPVRGPAARLAELEGRPQARGKPMAGARAD